MAEEPSTDQVLFATRAWHQAMRRLWVRRYGTSRGECPVRPFDEYGPEDRAIMERAIKAALTAAQPENVRDAIKRLET